MGCGLRGSAQMLEKAQATEHFTKSRGARQRAPLRDAILSMTNMHSYSTGPRMCCAWSYYLSGIPTCVRTDQALLPLPAPAPWRRTIRS